MKGLEFELLTLAALFFVVAILALQMLSPRRSMGLTSVLFTAGYLLAVAAAYKMTQISPCFQGWNLFYALVLGLSYILLCALVQNSFLQVSFFLGTHTLLFLFLFRALGLILRWSNFAPQLHIILLLFIYALFYAAYWKWGREGMQARIAFVKKGWPCIGGFPVCALVLLVVLDGYPNFDRYLTAIDSRVFLVFFLLLPVYGLIYLLFHTQVGAKTATHLNVGLLENMQTELEQLQQQACSEQDAQVRGIQSDLQQYLNQMSLLLINGELDKALTYVEQLKQQYSGDILEKFSTNWNVNALLIPIVQKAKLLSINMKIEVQLPLKKNIRDAELCSIFFSSLSNAIESCSRVPDMGNRKIEVHTFFNSQQIFLEIRNSFQGTPRTDYEGNVWISDSESTEQTIESIQAIISKYNGILHTEVKANEFVLHIALCY